MKISPAIPPKMRAVHDEENPFLSPSGQPDSLIDALADAQRRTNERNVVVEIIDSDIRVAVIVLELRHV
jgi:hypothetical protein